MAVCYFISGNHIPKTSLRSGTNSNFFLFPSWLGAAEFYQNVYKSQLGKRCVVVL